jgi:hypothetical protein
MLQPPGFKDLSKPDHVYKHNKAIYGFKQAPRVWYLALKTTLLQFNFANSKVNSSLFVYTHDNNICYSLIYMDDLIIIGNISQFVCSIIDQLGWKFSLKDTSTLHYFLGVEVLLTQDNIFLS